MAVTIHASRLAVAHGAPLIHTYGMLQRPAFSMETGTGGIGTADPPARMCLPGCEFGLGPSLSGFPTTDQRQAPHLFLRQPSTQATGLVLVD